MEFYEDFLKKFYTIFYELDSKLNKMKNLVQFQGPLLMHDTLLESVIVPENSP